MTDTLGPVSYVERQEDPFLNRQVNRITSMSEATAVKIDTAVRNIVDACEDRARRLLEENRDKVERVGLALLEHEMLSAADVETLMAGKPLERPGIDENETKEDSAEPSAAAPEASEDAGAEESETTDPQPNPPDATRTEGDGPHNDTA